MISLYDYLGRPAGPELGKQVSDFAVIMNAKFGTKTVPHSKYKGGLIFTYEKSFLDQFFKAKDLFTKNKV